jgi:hypothetical protein
MEMTRGYRLRDGSSVTGKVWVHPDPRVQAVLEQVRERETAQAIDRLRLIHRTNPARVIVLSNLVLDLTIDRLTTWREIMPSRFEQAAARGPAVPLSASELHRCFPKLWLSAEAVRMDFKHAEKEKAPTFDSEMSNAQSKSNGVKPHIEVFLYGKRPYLIWSGCLKVRYRRLGKSGRASPAIIRADADDPRAALESVVGPVDWFEVDLVAEPVPEQEVDAIVEAEPVNGHVFPIDAAPAEPAADRVVPLRPPESEPPPTSAGELQELQRVLAAADRLADLSARLEVFRPPPDLARRRERVAVLQ